MSFFIDRKGTMTCEKPPVSDPQNPGKATEPRYSNPDFPEIPDYCEIISDSHYDNVEHKTNTYQKPDVISTAPPVYQQLHIWQSSVYRGICGSRGHIVMYFSEIETHFRNWPNNRLAPLDWRPLWYFTVSTALQRSSALEQYSPNL